MRTLPPRKRTLHCVRVSPAPQLMVHIIHTSKLHATRNSSPNSTHRTLNNNNNNNTHTHASQRSSASAGAGRVLRSGSAKHREVHPVLVVRQHWNRSRRESHRSGARTAIPRAAQLTSSARLAAYGTRSAARWPFNAKRSAALCSVFNVLLARTVMMSTCVLSAVRLGSPSCPSSMHIHAVVSRLHTAERIRGPAMRAEGLKLDRSRSTPVMKCSGHLRRTQHFVHTYEAVGGIGSEPKLCTSTDRDRDDADRCIASVSMIEVQD